MTKYVVCTPNSRIERTSQADADALKDATPGSWIDIVQEPDAPYEMPYIEVGIWQMEIVLNTMNLLEAVQTQMNQLPEPMRTNVLIAWTKGKSVETTSQAVQLIKEALEMSDEQIVALFQAAKEVTL